MSVAEVRRVSTTKVQPASYSCDHNYKRIDLNPWDIVYLKQVYLQKGLLFAKSSQSSLPIQENEENMVIHLKSSLSYALDHFFPLAGRLGIQKHEDDNTISVYINCNSEGAEFIHATADISIDDIISQPYDNPNIIDPLFSLNAVANYEGQSHPLLSVQITELLDGVFIACSVNHSVCDGTSFWQFVNLWSEISRSSNNQTQSPCPPPVFERWSLRDTDCPICLPFPLADEFSMVRNISNTKVVLFRGHHGKIKARANSENRKTVISSLQAVLAHIWIAVLRARSSLRNRINNDEETVFGFVTNNRRKLIPPLPEAYFGNSGSCLLVAAKDGEVLRRGFGYLASLLNKVVNYGINDEKIRSAMESRTKKPVIIPADEAGVTRKDILARSSHKFNMYGNDFGWGRPIAMKNGVRGKSHGVTTVNEGPVEGSMDIEISLPVEVFTAMGNDVEFMDAFSF
ncbi:hypothetical protein MKW98_016337 [Papaver atlanticum]|uniref:Uncharacterized protein n=1 Tax=Papaver atlanticum TaxID=357466 RepID=A0AAD4SH04_9MAGN|nr:hypothetical protein MKW98_016337 [Papaver atlanticum]